MEQSVDNLSELEQLRNENELLKKIIDTLPYPLFLKQLTNGQYVVWNKQAELCTGISEREVVSFTDLQIFGEELARHIAQHDQNVSQVKESQFFNAPELGNMNDGFGSFKKLVPTNNGAHEYIMGGASSYAPVKQFLENLNSEECFSLYMNSTADIVFTLDIHLRHTGVYGNWVYESGMKPSDFLGKTSVEILGEAARLHMNKALEALKGNKVVYEWSASGQDGEKYFQTSLSPITLKNQIVGIIGVGRDITELIESRNTILSKEIQYNELIEHLPGIVYRFSNKRGNIYCSSKFTKITGFTLQEFRDDPFLWNKSIHPNFMDNIQVSINELDLVRVSEVEYQFCTKDGNWIWLHDIFMHKTVINEEIIIDGYAVDITRQKQAEEIARETEQKFADLIKIQGEGVGIVDENEVFVFSNPAASHIFCVDNLQGKSLKDFLDDDNQWKVLQETNIRKCGVQSSYELKIRAGDGTEKFLIVTASPQFTVSGKFLGTMGVFRDITENVLTLQELKKSRESYKLLAENIADVIWSYHIEKTVFTYISPSVTHMIGYSPDEILAQTEIALSGYRSFVRIDEFIISDIQEFKRNPEKRFNYNYEVQHKHKDGRFIWLETNALLILNDKNEVELLGVSRNIDAKKNSVEKLEQYARQLEALNTDKNVFISILAHDLKNPFNSLLGFSDLLRKNLNTYSPEKVERQVTIVNELAHRAYNLLEDMLLWSKVQAGKIELIAEEIHLNDFLMVIFEEFELALTAKNISVNFCLEPDTKIVTDSFALKTVLRNLISNAVKFTRNSGNVNIGFQIRNQLYEFYVEDNGVGISEKNIHKLWDMTQSYTTEGTLAEKGTGLGLLICKEMVDKLQGQIWVESILDAGTTFHFTIPME